MKKVAISDLRMMIYRRIKINYYQEITIKNIPVDIPSVRIKERRSRNSMQKSKNRFKKMVISLLMICTLISLAQISVLAEDSQNVSIWAEYDKEIKEQNGDIFIIHIKSETVEKDIKIDASKAIQNGINISLPAGEYYVTDISYHGQNTKIKKGYGIQSKFIVSEGDEAYTELNVAIGPKSTVLLQNTYVDTIQKQNEQLVDFIETDISDSGNENSLETENTSEIIIDTTEEGNLSEEIIENETPEDKSEKRKNDKKEDLPKTNHALKLMPIGVACICFACVICYLKKIGKL